MYLSMHFYMFDIILVVNDIIMLLS